MLKRLQGLAQMVSGMLKLCLMLVTVGLTFSAAWLVILKGYQLMAAALGVA